MRSKSRFANKLEPMSVLEYVAKTFTVTLTICVAVVICDPRETLAMDLTQFQWKNRLLLLFAPDGGNPLFRKLQDEIAVQKAEVKDRDLMIFEVLEQGSSRMNTTLLDPQTADSIRDRFAVLRETFAVILVGKDGGVKLRRNDRTQLSEIFELIDAMPMRKNEMRQKRN